VNKGATGGIDNKKEVQERTGEEMTMESMEGRRKWELAMAMGSQHVYGSMTYDSPLRTCWLPTAELGTNPQRHEEAKSCAEVSKGATRGKR
jgi:hypothetical protein